MSYTPPSGSSANLKFGVGYSVPAGGAANLSFSIQGYLASGFSTASFGVPSTPQKATGFSSTAFGVAQLKNLAIGFCSTILGTPKVYGYEFAAGFVSTQIGLPRIFPYGAAGWNAARFGVPSSPLAAASINAQIQLGAPAGSQYFPTYAIPPVTKFGWPTTTVNQTGETYGFSSTGFGVPLKPISATVVTNLFCDATSLNTTQLGTPVAQANQTTVASGASTTTYGTPTLRLAQAASGTTSTQLGSPKASMCVGALGFKAATFGQGTHRRSQPASSTYRTTRWGLPVAERSHTYKAYRINTPTRFGRPKGYSRFNYPATAIHTTQLGIPTSFETHHAWRIEPNTSFGQPLLKRTPLC